MTLLLLVKPAVWRHAGRAAVVRSLVHDGAQVLTGHTAAELRAQIDAAGPQATVAACGGDGTVHLAVNAIAGTGVTLAVVPMGTGNDFARHLGLRGHAAGVAALQAGQVRDLDLGRIELADGTVRHFAGIASCGFDAQVNERANGYPGPPGAAKYLAAVLGELRKLAALDLQLTIDDQAFDGRYTLVAVGNSTSYGGGMRMCPAADSGDGWLDVTAVDEVARRTLLRVLPRVFVGTHVRHPAVTQHRAESVRISGMPFMVYADGERVGHGPARISVLRGALHVAAPA